MAITVGMIAKAAATALSNEKLRKGIGWGLVAVLSPVILLIAALCSIGTGGADHNNQAVAAAFYGTSYSTEVPMVFRSLKIADELSASAIVRGIESPYKKQSYYVSRISPLDAFLMLVSTAAGIVCCVLL